MNPATHGTEGNASAPVLYMAPELSNTTWRLALSGGATRARRGPGRGQRCLDVCHGGVCGGGHRCVFQLHGLPNPQAA